MHNMVTNEFLSYLMQNSTLFKDTSKQTYILFDTDGQNKLFIIGSKDFRAFLSSLYLSKYKNPLSPGERKMIILNFPHNIPCMTKGTCS